MTLRSFRDVRSSPPSSGLMATNAQGEAGPGRSPGGGMVLEDASPSVTSYQGRLTVHDPDEIAAQVGGINIKTLMALIRPHGLETTTLGYTEPARKGGRPAPPLGMTDSQLEALLALRDRGGEKSPPV